MGRVKAEVNVAFECTRVGDVRERVRLLGTLEAGTGGSGHILPLPSILPS